MGITSEFIHGFLDSFRGFFLIFQYDEQTFAKKQQGDDTRGSLNRKRSQSQRRHSSYSKEHGSILKRVGSCCCLNGVVYLLSLFLFNYFLLPLLGSVLELILNETSMAENLWSYIRPTLELIFKVLWVVPVFIISRLINMVWFQDIADSAYRQRQGRPQLFPNISTFIADTLISCIIQILFLIQATFVLLIPVQILAMFLHVFHMCLLNSLYSFEYRWCNMAWHLEKRLRFIEKNWSYFLGFGLPLSFLSALSPSVVISGCVWAMLFPVFIISANEATPTSHSSGFTLKLFAGVVWLSNKMAHVLFKSPRSAKVAAKR